jgi:parvulin-like peptidyl-prolyl isomerase
MFARVVGLAVVSVAWWGGVVAAQEKPAPAAVVNGEAIPETAVTRALKGIPAEQHAKARSQVVTLIVDNALIEQQLIKLKVDAPAKEVDLRMSSIKEEAKKGGQEYEKLLAQLGLTDQDLRVQVIADLRWETYVKSKAPEDVLAKFFAENKDWFDGSQVRGRHILVEVPAGADATAKQAAYVKIVNIQRNLQTKIAAEIAKIDPKASTPTKEQQRLQIITEAFAETATKESDCPSKKSGGDLGFFPRVGAMVEPFAKAAFSQQVGQMTGPVETQFGYHLILTTGKQPGKDVKFEDLKDDVREIVSERMREELVAELRKTAKIEIATPAKP